MSKTTLKPGDLVVWDAEDGERAPGVMAVSPDGQEFLFQFGIAPWSQMEFPGRDGLAETGLSVQQAEDVLNSPSRQALADYNIPGIIFKSYDAETGQMYPDPRLDLG